MDKRVLVGDNSPEDIRWLNSLSESELDLLISLKDVAVQRAKVVGHESLAKKFDLKMLRALSYILMQHVKGQINDLQLTGVDKLKEMLEGCNFLKLDLRQSNQSSGNENFTTPVKIDKRTQRGTKTAQTTPVSKRQKNDRSTPNLKRKKNDKSIPKSPSD